MQEIEVKDIADELLIINKATIERLFYEENQNPLVLYLFYYKTAKWQQCNPIKATDEYCKKCLHWGIDKLQATKKRLKDMELIEIIRKTKEGGKVEGWYIRVNYLINNTRIPETTIPIRPQLVSQETNTNNNKYINTNNNKKSNSKPTLEEVKEYCKERNNNVDPKKFFDYYEVNNWIDNKGNKVKNWKQKVITWENHSPDNVELPDWFNKDIKVATDEGKQKEMEEILKEFKNG